MFQQKKNLPNTIFYLLEQKKSVIYIYHYYKQREREREREREMHAQKLLCDHVSSYYSISYVVLVTFAYNVVISA